MTKKHVIIFLITVLFVSSWSAYLGVQAAKGLSPNRKLPVTKAAVNKNSLKKVAPLNSKQKKPDYVMVATAYSDRGETKSQIYAGLGSVAVDRKIIPHGTILYIEGYGLALATDTGRLIKGYRVDVWFPDEETVERWGRKNVKVWKVGQADIKKILSTGGKYVKY